MMTQKAASRLQRNIPAALLVMALLCALLPVLVLFAAAPARPLLPPSLAVGFLIGSALFAVLMALLAASFLRRTSTAPAERRLGALEEVCRTLKGETEQKDMLLRETHHRVKNDLQILTSTLRLSDTAELGAEDHEILTDSRNRIHAISLIHELLYKSPSLTGVSIRGYVSELVSRIERSLKQENDAVSIVSHIGDYYFDADTSVTCGLLVNELVTNSLKHAFPDGDSGVILVQVKRLEPGRFLLIVQDNGVGLPKECSVGIEESLGMRLVRALTEQLRGKLELESDDGTTWQIQFEAAELGAKV